MIALSAFSIFAKQGGGGKRSAGRRTASSSNYTPMTEKEKMEEAKAIAAKVKSESGIESLESRLSAAEERYDNSGTEKNSDRVDVLEYAVNLAYDNPYRYYIAERDVDSPHTPLRILKSVGKAITQAKYDALPEDDRKYYDVMTLSDASTPEEAKDVASSELTDGVRELMKFRKIVEDEKLDDEQKEKKMSKLVSASEYLRGFFNDDDYYSQFRNEELAMSMAKYNIPAIETFIEKGYRTVEDIMSVPEDEIIKWPGIGEKTLEKIREARAAISAQ